MRESGSAPGMMSSEQQAPVLNMNDEAEESAEELVIQGNRSSLSLGKAAFIWCTDTYLYIQNTR